MLGNVLKMYLFQKEKPCNTARMVQMRKSLFHSSLSSTSPSYPSFVLYSLIYHVVKPPWYGLVEDGRPERVGCGQNGEGSCSSWMHANILVQHMSL